MTNDKKRDFARNKVALHWLRWAADKAREHEAFELESVYRVKIQELEQK